MSAWWAMALSGFVFLIAAAVAATIAGDTSDKNHALRCRGAAWILFLSGVLLLAASPWWAVAS